MTEQSHGRYYAQELTLSGATGAREQIQEALDAGEAQDWNLVGVSEVPGSGTETPGRGATGGGVILYWDTQRPSFARSGG